MMNFDEFNWLPQAEAFSQFTRCCGSRKWAELMAARRPFHSIGQLLHTADEVWNSLCHDDWKEAFAHHPKIGDMENLKQKFGDTSQWASGEQSGIKGAPDEVLRKLADQNHCYEEKFGYIFIVCATGKGAVEMLRLLEERLINEPALEISVAAGEQSKITKLRLEKLFALSQKNKLDHP